MRSGIAAALAGALLLAGTTSGGATAYDALPGDELVPITQRAIAAIALERAPADTTTRRATWTRGRHAPLGADLRYDGDGESDGDLVRVTVGGPTTDRGCEETRRFGGCVALASPPGTTTRLSWEVEEPEEDPGYALVVHHTAEATVSVLTAGETVRRDPRTQTMRVPVETMTLLAQDARLRPLTSPDVVAAGDRLPGWEGGEPDPHALDVVPSSDRAVAAAYLLARGGYADVARSGPSPLRDRFVPGTLGARIQWRGRAEARGRLDVLALPSAPRWLTHPCGAARFAGRCVSARRSTGPVHFAWRPGRPGETWAVQRRRDQVVVVRTSGHRVPEGRRAAMLAADWWSTRRPLTRPTLGLTTTKEVSEDRDATRTWRD